MDKRKLSERDICTKYITPALAHSGWDVSSQVREEFLLTKGRIIVRGLASASRNCIFGTQTRAANAMASGYSAPDVKTRGATSVLNTPPSTPPAASHR